MLWVFLLPWTDWFGGWCDFSGLANKKTVSVQPAADKEMTVVLSTTKSKKQNRPAAFTHRTVMRKEFRKMAKAVKNQVIAPEVILDVLVDVMCPNI